MNIALLLAGGSGSRLGAEIPKQYIEVNGKAVIAYCLETLLGHPKLEGIWVVAQECWREQILSLAGGRVLGFSEPGKTRQLSIWNGLQDIKKCRENRELTGAESLWQGELVVLIHDAARPLVSAEMITACVEGCKDHEGVMPALPMKDTVYLGADGRIEALLDRSKVIAGQAPEAFRFDRYYEANARLFPEEIWKINGSTEPAVMAGLDVAYIPGEERNFKITTKADLERFARLISAEGEGNG